jgi:1,4-alpha-glucan branching enzyme
MDATILGNFDVVDQNVIPDFSKKGIWYEFYTGDSLNVSDTAATLALMPGEYRLYTTVKLPKPVFTGIDENNQPQLLNDHQVLVYPNPSDKLFNFVFNLPRPSPVEISIFNVLGHIVKKVAFDHPQAGLNNFLLDLSTEQEGKISAGIYFFRLDAGVLHESGKLVVE